MGARFAVTGGREGWMRTALTAVGVGLGVALLLLTTAIPNALAERHNRERDRQDMTYTAPTTPKADDTILVAQTDTTYRGDEIRGRVLQPEGPRAPLPPGVDSFPGRDEMVVSPALAELLKSDAGALLRDRLPSTITGTIGDSGLIGSQELAYYAGSDRLTVQSSGAVRVERLDRYGADRESEPLDPVLMLLVLMVFIVLLMPVGVFIATAVRFGGERRDRRLAALRLVGADGRMTRRIAAGEAVAGSLFGLVLGTGFFLAGREFAGSVQVYNISTFPQDLNPSPLLALLVALAVPAAAVAVTLFALRGVVIEPLGVIRSAKPRRRRLWWRLLLPLGGLGMLYPMIGQGNENGEFNQWLVTGGTVLVLVGITALLPWVVEAVVSRLGKGSVSWQLAVRRLQLSSGPAARMVNGIAVAVAGAIALQMLFAGVESDYTKMTTNDLSRAQMNVALPSDVPIGEADRVLSATRGVTHTTPLAVGSLGERRKAPDLSTELTVGGCAALREVAKVTSCRDGDVFAVRNAEYDENTPKLAKSGRTLYVDPVYSGWGGKGEPWRLPDDIKWVDARKDPTGYERGGLLATPGALPKAAAGALLSTVYLQLDPSVEDGREIVRNAAASLSPIAEPMTMVSEERNERFASIRTGLFVGAICVLLLIGASLLVSQLEQLRERKKLLSALIAFGTRRRTLTLSVLWQTALPIALGLILASVVGLTLGAALLKMTGSSVAIDWPSLLSMTGIGAGVVLLVTVLSLPPLLKLMRPDGLRTE
ncbi:ABC transporter permease [Streptomyces sp. NPDC091292]|uniref:ABC transporter permease n=1 Tax=Streptomyces sp. NPDC091292 TaxID=3365991 RepID=UPI00380C9E00